MEKTTGVEPMTSGETPALYHQSYILEPVSPYPAQVHNALRERCARQAHELDPFGLGRCQSGEAAHRLFGLEMQVEADRPL